MKPITYRWRSGESSYLFELIYVRGTSGDSHRFGDGGASRLTEVSEFWIATTTTTLVLWTLVTGEGTKPAISRRPRLPVENASWDELHCSGGFLDRINASDIRAHLSHQISRPEAALRLSSEAWEYAARGGPLWRDGFRYSGSNDIDLVAWYDRKWGDHTHDVALEPPNQRPLDMSGNVWEWCEDTHTSEVKDLRADGNPYRGDGSECVLRGGCFDN